jgi:hypothetical protein
MKIAADGRNGIGESARKEMVQWFLFNVIDVAGDGLSKDQRVEGAGDIPQHAAEPQFPVGDLAVMGAQMTMHPIVIKLFVEHGFFFHYTLSSIGSRAVSRSLLVQPGNASASGAVVHKRGKLKGASRFFSPRRTVRSR